MPLAQLRRVTLTKIYMKTPEVYGYAVMAHEKSPFTHDGQYSIFRLKRDAVAWRDRHYPSDAREVPIEIKNVLVKVSL